MARMSQRIETTSVAKELHHNPSVASEKANVIRTIDEGKLVRIGGLSFPVIEGISANINIMLPIVKTKSCQGIIQ